MNCGQSAESENDINSFLQHFLNDYFTFDSKIFKSILPLFSKPGYLTLEFLDGRRVSYIPPLRLFIFTSIIFFLLLGVLDTQSTEALGEQAEWDRFFESRLPKLFLILSPIFALLVGLLFKKRNNSYLVHFLFSLHFHATIFSAGIIYELISWTLAKFGGQSINSILLLITILFILIYLFLGLKNVYNERFGGTLWRFILLIGFYIGFIGISVLLLAVLSS